MKFLAIMLPIIIVVGTIFLYFNNKISYDYQKNITMKIESSAFRSMGSIPEKYTCDGGNFNPPLSIKNAPVGTNSLALIMDDPDVPKNLKADGLWVHWVLWNISPSTNFIDEGIVPKEAIQGVGSSGKNEYGGPCPPDKEHRYFFKLYALDSTLNLSITTDKVALEKAMAGHILEEAQLVGVYNRKK